MNNLQELKVIEVSKPTINFNYQAVKAQIDQLTEQYQGLVIQESDLQFTKDLLAYLNKLKKSVDDFRKDTKKEVSKPIATFEDQCKELVNSIDTVYSDIKKQYDDFEDKRRESRAQEVNELVEFARMASELPEKYKFQLIMKPEYLNKTMTDAKIAKDLEEKTAALTKEWELEKAKNAQIDMLCELITSNLKLGIAIDPNIYYHLDLESAREQIFEAGEMQKAKQDEAIAKIAEQARIEAEQKANAEIEQKAQELAQKQVEEAKKAEAEALNLVTEMTEQVERFVPIDSTGDVKRLSCTLKIYGTKSEMEALKAYIEHLGLTYERLA